jgi:hypothetical protein
MSIYELHDETLVFLQRSIPSLISLEDRKEENDERNSRK